MSKKFKNTIILVLALLLISMCACSKDVKGDDLNTEDSEITSNTENASQDIDKQHLGIHMSLSGEFADCIVEDLDNNTLNTINSNAIGGFSIIKSLNGTDYTISNVVVVPNSEIETAEQRSQYPYIFSGNTYSILGILPMLDATSTDYETLSQLQGGIVQQLCTIYFDEAAIADADTETPADTDTETPADADTETPADADTETPADTDTETPADADTETPADTDTETPADNIEN